MRDMSMNVLRQATVLILAAVPLAHAGDFAERDPFRTLAFAPSSQAQSPACVARLPVGELSLMDAVDLALCNNPQTRQAWANVRAQAAQVGVAESAYLPNVNATLSASRNWTGSRASAAGLPSSFTDQSASAVISYLLYDFGAREANLASAQQLLAAAAATQDSTIQALLLSIVQAYYQTQATGSALDAARQSERSALENLQAAEARYKTGVATPADKLQAQTAYSQAVLVRVQADGALKNAQGTLANAMGLDAQTPLTLATVAEVAPPKTFEHDVGALVEQARKRRPDLAAAHAQLEAAQADVKAARAAGLPSVSLLASSGSVNETGLAASHTTSIGVTINVPLFTGYATTYRVRAAKAQAEAADAQFDRLRLQIALDVWQAYQNLLTAKQSLQTTSDLLASAAQSQRVALGRYKAGVGTITDLLNADSALAAARQQRVSAAFNWNVSRAALAQAMGQLDVGALQSTSEVGNGKDEVRK